MLIVTYFLIFPYFRVSYSLTIIISYEWFLNSKGFSELIWKGSGPDILFCEVRGEKNRKATMISYDRGISFELLKLFTSGKDFSVGIRGLFFLVSWMIFLYNLPYKGRTISVELWQRSYKNDSEILIDIERLLQSVLLSSMQLQWPRYRGSYFMCF